MIELTQKSLGDEQQRLRTDMDGDRTTPGVWERLNRLEEAEGENKTMRDEWTALKHQLHGAKTTFIVGATLLGILGVSGFATLWGALADIAKALP